MKRTYLLLPFLFLFFISCEEEAHVNIPQADITEINFLEPSAAEQVQQVQVTILKPTPCHQVTEVSKSVTQNIFKYNFIIAEPPRDMICLQVIKEETHSLNFDPSVPGEYTLEFYINGEFYESRTFTVTK